MCSSDLDVAIQALEEIQQYRAIGTVKGYERAIESSIENYNLYKEYKAKVQDFEAIGSVEELKDLKEKNEPKKVVVEHIPKTSWTKEVSHYLCPSCRSIFSFGGKPYCSKCGQKLNWQ